jgi:hypothetical protein
LKIKEVLKKLICKHKWSDWSPEDFQDLDGLIRLTGFEFKICEKCQKIIRKGKCSMCKSELTEKDLISGGIYKKGSCVGAFGAHYCKECFEIIKKQEPLLPPEFLQHPS